MPDHTDNQSEHPPASCANCTVQMNIPSLAEFVRCFTCGTVNKILRVRGKYFTMKADSKKIPSEKIQDEIPQQKESGASALSSLFLGMVSGLAGMVLNVMWDQYDDHVNQEKGKRGDSSGNTDENSVNKNPQNKQPKMLE